MPGDIQLILDSRGNAGDWWCFNHAARAYARTYPEQRVWIETPYSTIVQMWSDSLVSLGTARNRKHVNVYGRHRVKGTSPDRTFFGSFLAALGLSPELPFDPPPAQSPVDGLYGVIQPIAQTAANPPMGHVQCLVDEFLLRTEIPLYAVGRKGTPQALLGVRYTQLAEGLPHMIRMIAGAHFVLSPRSGAAHIAAGYSRPTLSWTPSDGENWHIDYASCTHYEYQKESGLERLRELLLVHRP